MESSILKKIEAVDLFCGVGGLTAGLIKSGITVKAGYDIESSCQYPYEYNNGAQFILKDVKEVTKEEIEAHYSDGSIRLLAGCAPCQPFSTYNNGKDTSKDRKWPLLYAFARLIKEVNPELVTMENVPDVTRHDVYHDFLNTLRSLGYEVWADTVLCAEYGLPQMRRRHILLASKIGPIELIKPTHKDNFVTVADVIGGLPKIKAGQQDVNDQLHRSSALSAINIERIKHSRPGGSWKDWPEHLLLDCHRKSSGRTYGSVYGRMEWDKPAPTMTTQCYGYGNGRFGHPEQNRAISLREAAIFQGFPKEYQFFNPNTDNTVSAIGKMIGNAVPVHIGKIIGQSFQSLIKGFNERSQF